MSETVLDISVKLGEGNETATIKLSSRSTPIVANVLGIDVDASNDPIRIYLRSHILSPSKHTRFRGWKVSGAVSSILERVDTPT